MSFLFQEVFKQGLSNSVSGSPQGKQNQDTVYHLRPWGEGNTAVWGSLAWVPALPLTSSVT